mmetsp:Transcript_44363/g.120877  ORF Transcript_44363/g.120877 Transcript_44363/m.120877 type:complete len:228 (+) Transcript_44363:350-1033(+)
MRTRPTTAASSSPASTPTAPASSRSPPSARTCRRSPRAPWSWAPTASRPCSSSPRPSSARSARRSTGMATAWCPSTTLTASSGTQRPWRRPTGGGRRGAFRRSGFCGGTRRPWCRSSTSPSPCSSPPAPPTVPCGCGTRRPTLTASCSRPRRAIFGSRRAITSVFPWSGPVRARPTLVWRRSTWPASRYSRPQRRPNRSSRCTPRTRPGWHARSSRPCLTRPPPGAW